MSVFRKLFGNQSRPATEMGSTSATANVDRVHADFQFNVHDGPVDLEVVGESHYQENLWHIVGKRGSSNDAIRVDVHAVLLAEDDNPHDDCAISVWIKVRKVGYLSRIHASRYRSGLIELQGTTGTRVALPGVVVGGGVREDGLGLLGVFLRHGPSHFGLRLNRRAILTDASAMDTGLTDAMASDDADESYDLAWLTDLPSDPLRAIPHLRRLLDSDPDPIDRHFMFSQLQELLYRSRDVFVSALDDYDDCCGKHDAEMGGIRTAFMAKWGKIPRIPMYTQMCIRSSKAKRFDDALWWAERGLSIYAEDCARPDVVADLTRRADAAKSKLAPPARRKAPQAPHDP